MRWYWRLLATDERDFAFTNQLFGVDGHHRGQYDARAFAPGYWPVGTSGITTFEIDIDPEAPTGAYWLRVAMYDRNKQDISNLPVFDAQGNQAGNHLILGPIKVHGQPPVPSSQGSVSDPRVPDNLLTARFDDQIDLQGYSLSVDRLLPGESLDLTLFWAPRGRPMRDYTVFIHILDDQDNSGVRPIHLPWQAIILPPCGTPAKSSSTRTLCPWRPISRPASIGGPWTLPPRNRQAGKYGRR